MYNVRSTYIDSCLSISSRVHGVLKTTELIESVTVIVAGKIAL